MNPERTERLESALRNIMSMSRRAIVERPEGVPKGPWDFVLSSIEVYAEQALEEEPKVDWHEMPEKTPIIKPNTEVPNC